MGQNQRKMTLHSLDPPTDTYSLNRHITPETQEAAVDDYVQSSGIVDHIQLSGPVNQPTLFGSSIKAQNQWQRDEKEKFIQLLQIHGRNW